DSEPSQHALDASERSEIRLREPNRDTLLLRAMNAAISVEQTAEEAAVELLTGTFYLIGNTVLAVAYAVTVRKHGEPVGLHTRPALTDRDPHSLTGGVLPDPVFGKPCPELVVLTPVFESRHRP